VRDDPENEANDPMVLMVLAFELLQLCKGVWFLLIMHSGTRACEPFAVLVSVTYSALVQVSQPNILNRFNRCHGVTLHQIQAVIN
jgi:hypothetical protein